MKKPRHAVPLTNAPRKTIVVTLTALLRRARIATVAAVDGCMHRRMSKCTQEARPNKPQPSTYVILPPGWVAEPR